MIAYLEGVLQYKSPEKVIVQAGGVGYEINIPLSTFYNLPELGDTIALHIYTHIRPDIISLYGFKTAEEKEIFCLLIRVSKIGPKMARNILSGVSAEKMLCAIKEANIDGISSIPGVGKKTAQRIVLELKGVLPQSWFDKENEGSSAHHVSVKNEAISALTNLGFKSNVSEKAVKSVLKNSNEGDVNLEDLIKESLVLIYGGKV